MGLDVDVARWVLEFVLRQPEMDGLARKLLAVLPVSDDDLRLKKTVLLRALECEVADGSVTESVLEILEIVEEMDRIQGNAIPDSMRAAYCMTALECTVKFLVSSGGNPRGKYSKALNCIWRGRIGWLERYGKSELVSSELKEWWDEVKSVFDDKDTCRKLCRMNTRNDALFSICLYLEEAWGLMGPSFLELADGLRYKKKRVVDSECHGGKSDDVDERSLAALILLNQGKGLRLSEEICKEDDVYNSRNINVQCLEVQALTTVQLCNSLCMVAHVISDLQLEDMNGEHPWENQSGDQEVDEASPSPQKSTRLAQYFDVNIGKQSCRNWKDVHWSSFMECNSAARMYEWDESMDDSSEPTANHERRIHLPRGKRKALAPLKKNETKKRRKNKRWSLREEDILRTSVELFGNNWKFILDLHRDEFEERTEVDLKDKWRNMMKYGHC